MLLDTLVLTPTFFLIFLLLSFSDIFTGVNNFGDYGGDLRFLFILGEVTLLLGNLRIGVSEFYGETFYESMTLNATSLSKLFCIIDSSSSYLKKLTFLLSSKDVSI